MAHAGLDVLERCYQQLVDQHVPCAAFEAARQAATGSFEDPLQPLLAGLLEDLRSQASSHRIVLLFEELAGAESRTKEWLVEALLPQLADESLPVVTLVTAERAVATPGFDSCFHLEPFLEDELASHLVEKLGYPDEEARQKARGTHILSGGTPLRVLTYFRLDGERGMIEVAP
ncbi:MAG: hypothetical protein ACOC58_04345, partial [Chloroflexota bacterium]